MVKIQVNQFLAMIDPGNIGGIKAFDLKSLVSADVNPISAHSTSLVLVALSKEGVRNHRECTLLLLLHIDRGRKAGERDNRITESN